MPISKETIKISNNGTEAEINTSNMQLFSLIRHGVDVMWKGGAPEASRPDKGWQNSEIIMFPIVGDSIDGNICTGGANLPMAKHGIARDLKWEITEANPSSVSMVQVYEAWDEVENGKNDKYSLFPRSYQMNKSYSITDEGKLSFTIEVKNKSKEILPYAIGWHPAFITQKDSSIFRAYDVDVVIGCSSTRWDVCRSVSLSDVRNADGNVTLLKDTDRISYYSSGFQLTLTHNLTWGTQIWDKGEGLVALEPISATSLRRIKKDGPKDLLLMDQFRKLEHNKKDRFTVDIKIEDPIGVSKNQDDVSCFEGSCCTL